MSTSLRKLESLVELASETSSDRRRELLHDVADVFLDHPDTYSPTELQYFGDIMGKVAYDLERQVREELACKLADQAAAPPELIKRLASDEIAVAQPVIAQSPVLQQSDLIEIAETHGQEHMFAMTTRTDIGENLSDVLVEKGDDRVVVGLVKNETAQIAPVTLKKVVVRAETSPALQAPLAERPDLPAELIKDMLAFVSQDIRARILDQTNQVNAGKLDKILGDVGARIENQSIRAGHEKSKPEVLIEKLAANGQLDQRKLVEFAKQRKVPEFICGLAHLAELSISTIRGAIMDRSGERLAIVCKSCGVDQTVFAALVNHIWPDADRSIEQSCRLIALYDQVNTEAAQRVVRFWRIREKTGGAETKPAAAAQ